MHPANKIISKGLTDAMIALVMRDLYAIAHSVGPLGPVVSRVMDADDWSCHLEVIDDFWSSLPLSSALPGAPHAEAPSARG